MTTRDNELIELFLEPVRKCKLYVPAFGQSGSEGMGLEAFHVLYGNDPFYSWIGLNDPLMYAAHKAAGGITSIYRQVGVGSERLLRAILMAELGLTGDAIDWSYTYAKPDGKEGVHILDAKIDLADLVGSARSRFESWLTEVRRQVAPNREEESTLSGAVFEIRQGYKSADSKRQNADLRFGIRAYQASLLPVFTILSAQVSAPVIARYRNDGMAVLTGLLSGDVTKSTFTFYREVVGYDLQAFFERNTARLREEIVSTIETLLTPR